MTIPRLSLHLLFAAALFLTSCSSVYFGALEKVGVHKRDLMIKRVMKARDAQEEAKEQFQTTLQQFSQVTGFDGGNLQDTYETLQAAYDRSETKAKAVRSRNDDVESVSKALFREWIIMAEIAKLVSTQEQNYRTPPQNIEAERSVLGALMLERDAYVTVADLIDSKSFYKAD